MGSPTRRRPRFLWRHSIPGVPRGVVTVLHGFTDPEGDKPEGGIVQGSDGNLYGTTEGGGISNLGSVYRLTLAVSLRCCTSSDQTPGLMARNRLAR